MPVLTRFKLDGGTNQQAARKLLPAEGLLRRVVNLELRRDNELAVRPGFTALALTVYGQSGRTLVACDLISYDNRLFALGTLDNVPSKVTLFEYLGEVKGWRRICTQIPSGTRLREVGAPSDQEGGIASATCAAYNGYVCLAYEATTTADAYGHVFRASDDATLTFAKFSGGAPRGDVRALVSLGHVFHVVGLSVLSTALSVSSFTVASSESFSAATGLQSVDTTVLAAAAVGSSVGGYVTIGCLAGNLVVRHYNDSHVQQMTRTVNAVVPLYLAIAADGTADRIVFGYLDNADSLLKYRTLKLSDGSDVAGPTTLSATATVGAISVAIDSAGAVQAAGNITTTTPRKTVFLDGGGITWQDCQLTTEVFYTGNGNVPDNLDFAGFVQSGSGNDFTRVNAMGVYLADEGVSQPVWFKDFGTGGQCFNLLGSCCQDSVTKLFYSTSARMNEDLEIGISVNEWAYDVLERRQAAVAGGLLHIAGSLPLVFDGRQPNEVCWGEAPRIFSLAKSNTASGAITSLATYFIQVFAEMVDAKGNVHRGPPSEVSSITMGAADDTITGTIGRLHSFRNSSFNPGASYRLVICRTAALADLTAGENLYRETHVAAPFTSTFGNTVAFTLITSDAGLRALGATQGTIYTQGQTPIPHQAPLPCRYLWPTNDRLAQAGLPRGEQWLQSKLLFPGEAVEFSDSLLVQYQGRANEEIFGIAALSSNLVAFTQNTISLWQGEGPDHSGQGEFSFAGFISRVGGLIDRDGWRSLCETDEGIFFQRQSDQICLLGHDGHVEWGVGQNVRDELATYPVVTASCFIKKKYQVVFAVENAAGNAGELLVYDLRRKQWFIWDVWAKALADYQGRLVYANSSGAVFQQDSAAATGAMPDQNLETFDFDFGTGLSWGEVISVGVVGTKKGDCTVALDASFDSGANYDTAIGSWTVTTAGGFVTGKPIELEKAMPDRKHSRFALRLRITGSSGTEGIYINELVLETEKAPGMARLPARDTQ